MMHGLKRKRSVTTPVNKEKLLTLSPERYISRDYAVKEARLLWPQVWQVACREEEIPSPGDYITYEVGGESVIIIRTKSGEILAYHNVCPHRGRRLADGCGKAVRFRCGYHGWAFDIEGRNISVTDREDWNGALDTENLHLKRVRVDTWGGFVFIDFRVNGEILEEFLEEIPRNLGPYEYEKMRYRWYTTVHIPANWKVALEAFIEAYHVSATHPQLLHIFGDDYTNSYASGKHSNFKYERMLTPPGSPSPRLNRPPPNDPRRAVMEFFQI